MVPFCRGVGLDTTDKTVGASVLLAHRYLGCLPSFLFGSLFEMFGFDRLCRVMVPLSLHGAFGIVRFEKEAGSTGSGKLNL